ncbi:MAG: FtsX-like permease family protein [Pseudomonadota bacterium]
MSTLDKKLLRDLVHMWAQALAIALVMAAGVSTLVLAVGAYRSLEETRAAYYERHAFADVFATLTRAPRHLADEIAAIPGVATLETRIARSALVDVTGFRQPLTGQAISLPDHRELRLNRLYLRKGRLPEPGATSEVVVNEAFALAHGLELGDDIAAILNGRKRSLRIVGVALSPEFIYAIGPGDLMPDDRRFVVMWMSEKALAAIFDLEGAFNSVALKLADPASEARVIERLDALIRRYGGAGSYGREDHISHAFLDAELKQLYALARVIPPIFLFVSAFLINMTLSRLIELEREQIGLLKALGYARGTIAAHYVKLVLLVSLVGILIGVALGTWFGLGLTRLYAEFFHFPFLIFERDADVYLAAAAISAGAAVAGGLKAVLQALRLPPAVAMQPPAPPSYRRLLTERLGLLSSLSQLTRISLRHIVRWPLRAAFTVVGLALAASLMIVSLFSLDSVEHMIDVSFSLAQRQDATLNLSVLQDKRVLDAVADLPGVMRVEPYRSVWVRLRNGHLERKLTINGKPAEPTLARVVDTRLRPTPLPPTGLMVDEHVAEILSLRRGDMVEVEILGGWRGAERQDGTARRGAIEVPVTDIVQSYFGLTAYMQIDALNALLDDGPVVSGVHFSYDPAAEDALFQAIKSTPAVASIAMLRLSLAKFRETLAKNIDMMVSIYVGLAMVVAMGVVYNSARIQLSEQARELASLRVLGFTEAEVSRVLLVELTILVLLAQPLGWLLGYLFSWITIQGFSSDLYRAPFVIHEATYARASLVVMVSAAVSALAVRRRIGRFDLVSVLKTRD